MPMHGAGRQGVVARGRATVCAALTLACSGAAVCAQEAAQPATDGVVMTQPAASARSPGNAAQPVVLTVDIDRLFAQSKFGQRITEDYNTARVDLSAENGRIVEALRAEELDLAARRPDMDPALFQDEAVAFDEKARAIRQAQDAKAEALEDGLSQARSQFIEATRPILGQLMLERGATTILDQRMVLLSLSAADITDVAIGRIDDTLGEGRDTSTPETAPPAIPSAPED